MTPRTSEVAPWPGSRWIVPSLKRALVCAVSLVYFGVRSLASKSAPPRLVILYYHAVPRSYRPTFVAQMDRVLAGADAVVPAAFEGPASPGQLLVAVTFDDAFTSVGENAVPELRARGIPATIFAPGGKLGCVPDWAMEPNAEGRTETVMTCEQLRALSDGLIRIGSHTVSHPLLTLAEHSVAESEIVGSRRQLISALDCDVDLFSFPYGDHDERTVELCRVAGYRFAFTSDPTPLNAGEATFLRGRVKIRPDDSLLEFWLKMRGAYSWLALARATQLRSARLWGRARAKPGCNATLAAAVAGLFRFKLWPGLTPAAPKRDF